MSYTKHILALQARAGDGDPLTTFPLLPHPHEPGFGALPIASQSVFMPQRPKGRCFVAVDVG